MRQPHFSWSLSSMSDKSRGKTRLAQTFDVSKTAFSETGAFRLYFPVSS